jgi:hypothetical protein
VDLRQAALAARVAAAGPAHRAARALADRRAAALAAAGRAIARIQIRTGCIAKTSRQARATSIPGWRLRSFSTALERMIGAESPWLPALFMPAAASSGYQGASLDFYACEGDARTNCPLRSFDRLHFRVWIQFAEDHRYIHHFLHIGGSQPDDFWYHGTAGCMPNGSLEMGTTVDYREDSHESFFYTYFPGMSCDTSCERYADVTAICEECAGKGLPTCDSQPQCCWGNNYDPPTPRPFPIGRWFCLEMMMQANTPGMADGVQEYYIDGALAHRVESMRWRTSPTLALNRVRLQHYIETSDANGHSNRVWFDDMVVSTDAIGCD